MFSVPGPRLTSVQQTILDKFKTTVNDVMKPYHDDHFFVKWLTARNWDITKAEKMFREDQDWRQKNGVDDILTDYDPPEVLSKFYSGGYCGVSKEGFPIWIEMLANNDYKGLLSSVTKKGVVQYKCYHAERFFRVIGPELTKKTGKQIDKGIEIIDLEGLGLKQLWLPAIETYNEILTVAEVHYPDSLKAVYVINGIFAYYTSYQ